MDSYDNRSTILVVIANGASLSAEILLPVATPVAIMFPATWTAANLTFQARPDGGDTYGNVYDASAVELTVGGAAGRFIVLPPMSFTGIKYLKIRSGTAGSPVNQAAERTLQLVVKPLDR